ncbi:SnoaL-like domain-containing protein [Mycolicibacterium neoaurum]|uniref:nuclear transport factor 2 family protein n=1 Tax=Mycolicibacterium neoaurum TaxID=1795 RepID=UPI00055A656C|nr:nuclear transport factor 2 family protein [Mycolicibacterium neoaurum]SDD12106.1 SnoaL-like domain-containing protein [Mycolicibacterium neoaurum]
MTEPMAAVRRRLDLLEAREDIRRLKHRYAYICDTGYDGEAFANLFTPEGIWESNTFGVVRGHREIRDFINRIGDTEYSWAIHYMTCLEVDLDESATVATGTWQLLQLCTRISSPEPEPVLATAIYRDDLVKTDDGWRFRKVSATFQHVTDMRSGWGPNLLPGLVK